MVLMVLFAIICCYTTILMRYCFESRERITSYPDIGEATFGKYGRIIVSVSLSISLFKLIENCCAMLLRKVFIRIYSNLLTINCLA